MFRKKSTRAIYLGMTKFIQPVILCGGSGTRLWPLSRSGFPKQFLCLTGTESLFQQAAKRLAELGSAELHVTPPLIVTGEEHRFLAVEQLREVGVQLGAALLEPIGRNTAPALTFAALAAQADGFDPILVVTPADQAVVDAASFTESVHQAVREASRGSIVILGIKPTLPETGYGYIKASAGRNDEALQVQEFVEKPDVATAKRYLIEGDFFWNAGIFVLKASVWLDALKQFRPDILQATIAAWQKRSADRNPATPFVRPGKVEFATIPSDSIDYAVIERCPRSTFSLHMAAGCGLERPRRLGRRLECDAQGQPR
jgi:mannose-1-phosphate guanylyltransferase/mannose-6-phosphate isomerase